MNTLRKVRKIFKYFEKLLQRSVSSEGRSTKITIAETDRQAY